MRSRRYQASNVRTQVAAVAAGAQPGRFRRETIIARVEVGELAPEVVDRRKQISRRIDGRLATRDHVMRDHRAGKKRSDAVVADRAAASDDAVLSVARDVVREGESLRDAVRDLD